jgi:hypothetical protein
MVQEVGFAMLQGLGITLIAADSPTSFLDDGPTSKLIRQILGAVSEFDKAMIVAKLNVCGGPTANAKAASLTRRPGPSLSPWRSSSSANCRGHPCETYRARYSPESRNAAARQALLGGRPAIHAPLSLLV